MKAVSETLKKRLKRFFGGRFSFDTLSRVCASFDASRVGPVLPIGVLRPESADDVVKLVRFCNREKVGVVARGAASGMTGGAVPTENSVVIDFSSMNRILEINPSNRSATVEPGVLVGDLQRAVAKYKLFYPPDPASADFCTIGGSLAECAGGLRALKYGVTRDYLLAAKVVTGNGKRLHLGSYAHKSVAGYDVLRLLVGSEGTLALFIEITLKLISLPEASATLLATFTNPTTALVTSNNLLQEGFLPRTLEFVDSTCLDALAKNLEKKPQWLKKGSSLLLIEFDGTSSEVRKNTRKCAEFLRHFADKLLYGYSAVRQKELWSLRRGMSSALFGICEDKVSEDVAVPLSALPQLYTQASRIAKKFGLKPAIYGHAGDGNLHINFLLPKRGMPTDEAVKQLLQEAVSLGGTITGEHGIGLTKSKYLGLELDKEVIALMKRLKKVFDPNNILNPTKIFQC